jgi:hypothetical protein
LRRHYEAFEFGKRLTYGTEGNFFSATQRNFERREKGQINLLSQRMIIINTKSFLKLFGQLLRFIACFLSCPGNIFSLSAPEHSSVQNRNKKFPEKILVGCGKREMNTAKSGKKFGHKAVIIVN